MTETTADVDPAYRALPPVGTNFNDYLGPVMQALRFCDRDPRDKWSSTFEGHDTLVAAGGVGRLDVCVPFLLMKHGTNIYTDDLF